MAHFSAPGALCILVVALKFAISYGIAYGLLQAHMRLALGGLPAAPVLMISTLVAILLQAWLVAGKTYFFLNVCGGKPATIGNLFAGGPWLLGIIGATILFFIVFCIGFVLLIVPGIVVALMWSQYIYLIIDRGQGPLEALRTSREIMRVNKSALFGIYFVTFLPPAVAAGAWSLVQTGALQIRFDSWPFVAVMPWFGVLAVVCHLIMTGQTTADQAGRVGIPGAPAQEVENAV